MVTGKKIIVIQMTFKKLILEIWKRIWNPVNGSFGTKHHRLDLGMLEFCEYKPLSLYKHTPTNACKNTIASIRTRP